MFMRSLGPLRNALDVDMILFLRLERCRKLKQVPKV